MERDTEKPVSNDLQKNVLKVIHHRVVQQFFSYANDVDTCLLNDGD